MTWWTATSVSVPANGTIVSVNVGDDVQIAQEAGGLVIGANPPVEIKRTYLDGTGNKKIELRSPWPYSAQTAQKAVAFPTDADLAEATRVLRELGDDVAGSLVIATQAEAEAGTENTKKMTPLRVWQAAAAWWNASAMKTKLDGLVPTTSPTDTTAGRLLKVADAGLLATATGETVSANLDTWDTSVFNMQLSSGATGGPESGDGAMFTHKQWAGSDSAYQEFHRVNKTYERHKWSSVFTSWFMRYQQNNILGTVSQSGGVPTGSIIQRGSNAQGEFVRFADGTQICTRVFSYTGPCETPFGALFISPEQLSSPYPAVFSSLSAESNFVKRSGANAPIWFASGTGNAGPGNFPSGWVVAPFANSENRTYTITQFAIGRWY